MAGEGEQQIPLEDVELEEKVEEEVEVAVTEIPKAKTGFRANPHTALAIVTFAFFVDYLLLLSCVPILPLIGIQLNLSEFRE